MLNPQINQPDCGDEGYLLNPDDWSESLAVQLAQQENIVLTDQHWQIIHFIREWYQQKQIAPSARDVSLFLKDHNLSYDTLYQLFPYGYARQACKIAGMKKPRAWSTG